MILSGPPEKIKRVFYEKFGGHSQWLVRAPGRVNLIGEHTDYNDGFVLPMAIDRSVWIALQPRPDTTVRLFSIDFESEGVFSLEQLNKENNDWIEYIKGVAWAMMEDGHKLNGWEGVIGGNIPIGAGLSSSAATELAGALAFSLSSDITWDGPKMARISQKAENKWVGVSSGIMDQMISACGKKDHALLIDCRSLDTQLAPLPSNSAVVILDTGTRRELVGSAYNERRMQCESAAAFFKETALRDVTIDRFEQEKQALSAVIAKRARHIIYENERTLKAAEAMDKDDPYQVGQLMNESHISLRDDFEVSSDALDIMSEIAQKQSDCYGARMTGGGFGGCAVALVADHAVQEFKTAVGQAYQTLTTIEPKIYICRAENGAEVLSNGST